MADAKEPVAKDDEPRKGNKESDKAEKKADKAEKKARAKGTEKAAAREKKATKSKKSGKKKSRRKKRKKGREKEIPSVYSTIRALFVLGYVGLVIFAFLHPLAPRVFWTIGLPILPIAIVIAGYHPWRRVCPLAFWGELGRKLNKGEQRRVPKWMEEWFFVIAFCFLATMLVFRHMATNGDGIWLGSLLIGLGVFALLTNWFFTGKTWCNFICPVGMVERIYTEPNSLPPSPEEPGRKEKRKDPTAWAVGNSQCIKCTACKKNCPDIDQENSYWKDVDTKGRRLAYYSFPGLVTAFYTYYYLRYGHWESYFGGGWTRENTSFDLWFGDGFFFLPQVPALAAALVTHFGFAAISYFIFLGVERVVSRFFADDEQRIRHVTLTIAAFAAFNLFYFWAGQPSLRLLSGGTFVVAFIVPIVATLFLIKRIKRQHDRYLQEKSVKRVLRKWDFEEPPPRDPAEVFAFIKAHEQARDKQLLAYKEAIAEVLADGVVTSDEQRLLDNIKAQLDISDKEHKKIIAELTDDQRVLFEEERVVTIEERVQIEGYRNALALALARDATDHDIEVLRIEYGIGTDIHRKLLEELRSSESPLVSRARDLLGHIEVLRKQLSALSPMNAVGAFDFLIYALLKKQDGFVDRILDILAALGDEDVVRRLTPDLFGSDKDLRKAALDELREAADSELVDALEPTVMKRRPHAGPEAATALKDTLAQLLKSDDRYVIAGAVYALAELKVEEFKDDLVAALDHPDPLVRETAIYASISVPDWLPGDKLKVLKLDPNERVQRAATEAVSELEVGDSKRDARLNKQVVSTGRTAAPTIPDTAFSNLATFEKILFLRCVPLFTDFDPDELQEVCDFTDELTVVAPDVVVNQGDRSRDLYVIVAGSAEVVVDRAGEEQRVATLMPGQHFGELSALDGSPRSATVRPAGKEPLRLLAIDGNVFRSRLINRPDVALRLMQTVSGRLREALAAARS